MDNNRKLIFDLKRNNVMIDAEKQRFLELKEEALKKHVAGNALTLEETAYAMWDPNSENRPMSAMGILKIERRALDKLKHRLSKYGITSLDDIFDPKYRELAKPISSIYSK